MANIPEFEWTIDASGKTEDVIATVQAATCAPYKKLTKKFVDTSMVYVEVDVSPSDEDLVDFERARAALLAELADVKAPYAGVCARYQSNRQALGGYTMSISCSAYDRWE